MNSLLTQQELQAIINSMPEFNTLYTQLKNKYVSHKTKESKNISETIALCEALLIIMQGYALSSKKNKFSKDTKKLLGTSDEAQTLFQANQSQYTTQNQAKLFVLGAKIVFRLRTILTGEEITVRYGQIHTKATYDNNGKKHYTHNGELTVRDINQDIALQHLTASISGQTIKLERDLVKLQNYQKTPGVNDFSASAPQNGSYSSLSGRLQSWNQILDYGIYNYRGYNGRPKVQIPRKPTQNNPDDFRYLYQAINKDKNVWVGYTGRFKANHPTGNKLFYYATQPPAFYAALKSTSGSNFVEYNEGWLFEWLGTLSKQHYKALMASLADTSSDYNQIKPLILKKDNVAGYKGGDYGEPDEDFSFKQYQSKLQNRKIITFHSIVKVLTVIVTYLKEFLFIEQNIALRLQNTTNGKAYTANALHEAGQKLLNLFIDDEIPGINRSMKQTLQKMIVNTFNVKV